MKQQREMKANPRNTVAILAGSCFVIGTLLLPIGARGDDRASDRAHPMTFAKDAAITAKIKAKLADEKMSSLAHVRVDTDRKGAVVLSGNVRSQREADKTVAIARATEGVTSVTSHLRIRKDD